MSDLELQIRTELATVADDVQAVPGAVVAALAAGRRLRRRRIRAARAFAVCVLVVGTAAVLGPWLAPGQHAGRRWDATTTSGHGPARAERKVPPAPSTSTPSSDQALGVLPAAGAAWLATLRSGAPRPGALKVPYLDYAGTRHEITEENSPEFLTPTSRGWLVAWHPTGFTGAPDPSMVLGLLSTSRWRLTRLDSGVIGGAAVSPDGRSVAYARLSPVTGTGRVVVRDLATGAVTATSSRVDGEGVLGWGAAGVLALANGHGDGTWDLRLWSPGGAWRTIARGETAQAAGDAPTVLVLNGQCGQVLSVGAGGRPVQMWQGCGEHQPLNGALAPDGHWVLTRTLELVDVLTGTVTALPPPRARPVPVSDATWESPTAVLVTVLTESAPGEPVPVSLRCRPTTLECQLAPAPGG
ncbi:MAG TPA: hypothetical protein VLW53_10505 [Candidatus Eisenbacteria bacterium]|nr:hypothetical protein [Candidatus Eisenbacteria bacterium]